MRRPLGQIADVFAGLMLTPADREPIGRPGEILTVRSLTGLGIDAGGLERLYLKGRDVSRFTVRTGDVLLSARSTSLKTAVVPAELDGTLMNATLLGIRCSEAIHPRFLKGWLDSKAGQAALAAVSQSGTAQMNVTVAGISDLSVPIPSVEHQHTLVQLLEAADDAYQSAIAAADMRRRLAYDILTDSISEKFQHHE